MRELTISFFLLFLLFVCLDVSTTSYSLGIKNALFEEIDSRIALGASNMKDAIKSNEKLELDLKKVYPVLSEYSLGWVELFDSKKNLIISSDFDVRFIPEIFPDTAGFWGYRYGLFPFDEGYLLVSASEEEFAALERVSHVSFFLRVIVYFSFIALGVYIFLVFSYPFKKVREVAGKRGEKIDYTMKTIKEMAKDYREKLKSVKEREKELKQRLFLSKLGENVSQVLHEIRNSTGAIFGFGKLVEDEEIRTGILEETSRLNDFSMHLLSLAAPLELHTREINIRDLIKGVIKKLDNLGIEIKVQISDNINLEADEELLERAIYNILDNALAACEEKGKVFVSVKQKKDKVNILVEDTGVGMDKKTLSSVFDLFFTKKDGGVGVGMSVAKRIIESHDGDIKVKSKPGKGSKVLITLPLKVINE
jgi:signal transduction histidine kinase